MSGGSVKQLQASNGKLESRQVAVSCLDWHLVASHHVRMASDPLTLGTRIRRARERARLSQDELAKLVDASRRAVGDWENDRRKPRNRLGALEQVLGVNLGEEEEQVRPISTQTRQEIEDRAPSAAVAAYVIGLLEGTVEVTERGEEPGEGASRPRTAG